MITLRFINHRKSPLKAYIGFSGGLLQQQNMKLKHLVIIAHHAKTKQMKDTF